MVTLTQHAKARSQQRNVPAFVIDVIMDYGQCKRKHGADVYFLDKKSRKSIRKALGRQVFNRLSVFWNSYAVVSDDGPIITVGKRTKRMKFN